MSLKNNNNLSLSGKHTTFVISTFLQAETIDKRWNNQEIKQKNPHKSM